VSVGKSYLKNELSGYLIGTNFTQENWEEEAKARPAILIDGLHHSRELTGLSMEIYTLLRLLFEYQKKDVATNYLLREVAIFMVPVVN